MACDLSPEDCRCEHVAAVLQLKPKPKSPGDWAGRCPSCGHGGFAISKPTLTRMRNMWVCNCKICNGGNGCAARVVRAAMIRKRILPWCLGSYVGKDKPEADLEQLRRIAQTVDDLIACCPALSASDMVMLLVEARGDKIPDEYGACATFAKELGMSNGNAYNVARKWTAKPDRRPPDSAVPPHPGGGSQGLKSYHMEAEPGQMPRSELQNLPRVGKSDSKSWNESRQETREGIPTFGKRASQDKSNLPPAA